MIRRIFIKMVPITFLSSFFGWRSARGGVGETATVPDWVVPVFQMIDGFDDGTDGRRAVMARSKDIVTRYCGCLGNDWPTVRLSMGAISIFTDKWTLLVFNNEAILSIE